MGESVAMSGSGDTVTLVKLEALARIQSETAAAAAAAAFPAKIGAESARDQAAAYAAQLGNALSATYLLSVANPSLPAAQVLASLSTGLLKSTTSTGAVTIAVSGTDYVAPGSVTTSGLSFDSIGLLGRFDSGTGAIQTITIGSGLSLSAGGVLSATGGGGGGAPTTATYIVQTSEAGLSNAQVLASLSTGLVKVTTGTGVLSVAVSGTDYVVPGSITTNGVTMNSARLLGRTTASAGAVEEITVGNGLTLNGGTLSATGPSVSALTYAGTVNLDFSVSTRRTLAITGDITLTGSGYTAGCTYEIWITADTVDRTLTVPGNWWFGGSTQLTTLTGGKRYKLSAECWGATDGHVAYAVVEFNT